MNPIMLLTAIVMATSASSTAKAPAANLRAEVQTFTQRYFRTMNEGDLTALMEMYAQVPEVTTLNDGEISRGWQEISKDVESLLGQAGHYQVAAGVIEVVPLGTNFAVAYASASVTEKDGEQATTTPGAFSFVLKKMPGGWRILHEHYSTKPEEPSEGD